ncbi:WAT1-related protein At2g39510 [Ziziphus jujuba]|uniref:WAT1-related protein At2g39510 n=1 Tax=Ziziphus jujuba TaxID=326968 RepID=A0ABM4AGG5_ZIZJJ|nr:WAT1-related protein At2g39510 [Ziziphus jujuba]
MLKAGSDAVGGLMGISSIFSFKDAVGGLMGFSIISKFALNQGMSQHVLVVYRHVIATAVIAPFAIFLDRLVIDQNLFYTGMKLTTATFAAAISNVYPAFAFAMAWVLRLEKVKIRSVHSLAKILGTIVTVGGVMFMTLVRGPTLNLPWARSAGLLSSSFK